MKAEVTSLLSIKIDWAESKKLKNKGEISIYYTFANYGKIKVSVRVKPEDFPEDKISENNNPTENKKPEVCDTTFFEKERELLIRIPLSQIKDPITIRFSGEIEDSIPVKSFQIDIEDD